MIDLNGRVHTVQQQESWLYQIVTNYDLLRRHWDKLRALDRGPKRRHIQPGLEWVAVINHRDQLMNSPLWEMFSDSLKAWVILLDDAEIEAITRQVIHDVVVLYEQEWEAEGH
jgi:hypothetical protein